MSYKASMACAGAFAAVATLAGTAFAAEPPPPPPVPVFTWTGLYLGGQIGYAWGNDNFFYGAFDPLTGLAFTPSVFSSPSGVIGGAHVGFNYQIDKPTGGFVLGIEGSVDGTSLSNTVAASLPAFGGSSVSASTNTDIQGSNSRPLRHRLGSAPGLWHRWRRVRRFQHQLLDLRQQQRQSLQRLRQLFEYPRGLDGRRRYRLCGQQQLVGIRGIPLYRFRHCRECPACHCSI